MKAICAWCRRLLRDGPEPATHGICPECSRAQLRELQRSLQETRWSLAYLVDEWPPNHAALDAGVKKAEELKAALALLERKE